MSRRGPTSSYETGRGLQPAQYFDVISSRLDRRHPSTYQSALWIGPKKIGFLAILLKRDRNHRPRSHELLGRLRDGLLCEQKTPKISADALRTDELMRFIALRLVVGACTLALAMERALGLEKDSTTPAEHLRQTCS